MEKELTEKRLGFGKKRGKLKIAQISPYYYPSIGGVESVVQYTSEELVKRGHDVFVFTANRNHKGMPILNRPKKEYINGVGVFRFINIVNKGHMSFCPSLIGAIWKGDFDVIHFHGYRHPHGEIASMVGKWRGILSVLHGHGPFIPVQITGLRKAVLYNLYDMYAKRGIFKRIDGAIAINEFEKERYIELGLRPGKIRVIPNAASGGSFKPVDPSFFRSKYNLRGKRIILFLGNLNPVKRPDLLMLALPKVIKEISHLVLVFVGPDEGMYNYVRSLGKQLNLENYFRLIGPLYGEEKNGALEAAELLLLPSDADFFPLSILEAMAHGKPVIGSDAIGPAEIIRDGDTGYIVRKGHVEDIVKAIIKLLKDPDLSKRMGEKARRVAKMHYSVDRVVNQIEEMYFDLLEDRRHRDAGYKQ